MLNYLLVFHLKFLFRLKSFLLIDYYIFFLNLLLVKEIFFIKLHITIIQYLEKLCLKKKVIIIPMLYNLIYNLTKPIILGFSILCYYFYLIILILLFLFYYFYSIIVNEPTSSIRSFNIEVTTEPQKHGRYSAWLAKASYADKIFVR